MPVVKLDLDSTLGAAFIGHTLAAALYGVTSLQTFAYFRSGYRDENSFKCLIAFLWVLDSVHLAFTTHGLYCYLITDYANPFAMAAPTWSLLAQVYITCLSDFIVRCVFSRRIWLLSGRNPFLLIVIILISGFVFATGVGFATSGFVVITFARLTQDAEWMLYSALGAGVVADLIIAVSLCILLHRNHTGFKRTDSLVNFLILYSINTGLLTTVCATACFITFALWPKNFIFMGIYFALGKLYLNSLLGVLNSRESLREKGAVVSTFNSSLQVPMRLFAATTSQSTLEPKSPPYGKEAFAV